MGFSPIQYMMGLVRASYLVVFIALFAAPSETSLLDSAGLRDFVIGLALFVIGVGVVELLAGIHRKLHIAAKKDA